MRDNIFCLFRSLLVDETDVEFLQSQVKYFNMANNSPMSFRRHPTSIMGKRVLRWENYVPLSLPLKFPSP